MIKIIKHRDVRYVTHHELFVPAKKADGSPDWRAGYSFNCLSDGTLTGTSVDMRAAALARIETEGERHRWDLAQVRSHERRTVIQEKTGRCDCGEEIVLNSFTNSCGCGRSYNGAGQELRPQRASWDGGDDSAGWHLDDRY